MPFRSPTRAEIKAWPKPNWFKSEPRSTLILTVEIPLLVAACVVVALRFYARTYIKRVLGWDDWVMLAATCFAVTITALHCACAQLAEGRHMWDVYPTWIFPTAKMSYATLVLFAPAASLTKISICMTHLRVLPSAYDRRFAKAAIGFCILYCISITLAMTFQCVPIRKYWVFTMKNARCLDDEALNIAAQALNSFSDFLIFLWPSRTLWTLRLPKKQRYGLIFIFSFGVVVCVAGVCRVWYLTKFFKSYDVFYHGAILFILHGIELNVGIICGSLPGVKPLLARAFPSVFGTNSSGYIFSPSCRLPGQRLSIYTDSATCGASAFSPHSCHAMPMPHPPPIARLHPSQLSVVTVPIKYEEEWDDGVGGATTLLGPGGKLGLVGVGVPGDWVVEQKRPKSGGDV